MITLDVPSGSSEEAGPSSPIPLLKQFQLSRAPRFLYLIPEFITNDEEAYLLDKVHSAPKVSGNGHGG